jgi:hypothetical protein
MRQIEKDKDVFVRKGSKVLVGDAKEVVTTQAPRAGKILEPPLTVFLGVVDIKTDGDKVLKVAHRRVVCPGKLTAANGDTLTLLPTSELVATV